MRKAEVTVNAEIVIWQGPKLQDGIDNSRIIQTGFELRFRTNPYSISDEGIRLSDVVSFFERNNIPKDWSTRKVCELIKEMTKMKRCSWIALSTADLPKSEFFISHAWDYNFWELLECLTEHFKCIKSIESNKMDPDPVIWLDIFCVSQHMTTKDANFWSHGFEDVIKATKQTIVVLSSYAAPINVTRAWCLLEVAYSRRLSDSDEAGGRAGIIFLIHQTQRNELSRRLENGEGLLTELIGKINFEAAECFVPEDREFIMQRVISFFGTNKESAFKCLNELVFSALTEWSIESVVKHAAKLKHEKEMLKKSMAKITESSGRKEFES
jgi:hypothetical protein